MSTDIAPEVGQRIVLVDMPDDPDPVPPGTHGIVRGVTRFDPPQRASRSEWDEHGRPVRTGLPAPDVTHQVDVEWENGRSLFLLLPKDRFRITERST